MNIKIYLENGARTKLYFNNKPLSIMGPNFKVVLYDSTIVDNEGYATFKLKMKQPEVIAIESAENGKWCSFIASPGDSIKIEGVKEKINRSKVIGSKENDLFRDFEKNKIIPIINSFSGRKMSYDSTRHYLNQIYLSQFNFVAQNPKAFSSLLIYQDLSTAKDIDASILNNAKELYKINKSNFDDNELINKIDYNFFELPFKPKLGDKISKIKYNPKYTRLKSLGRIFTSKKYTLIDFWATWCLPCIKEMPNFDSIYKKYSKKGFSILSISSDVNKPSYVSFEKQKKYKWNFYVDFYGQQSLPIKQFRVDSYPTNFLLDEKGVIVAINIKPDKLEDFLKEKLF